MTVPDAICTATNVGGQHAFDDEFLFAGESDFEMTVDLKPIFHLSRYVNLGHAFCTIVKTHVLHSMTKQVIDHDEILAFQVIGQHIQIFHVIVVCQKFVQLSHHVVYGPVIEIASNN